MPDRPRRRAPRILFVEDATTLGGAQHTLLDLADAHREQATVALLHGRGSPLRQEIERRGLRIAVLGGPSLVPRVARVVPQLRVLEAVTRWRAARFLTPLAREHDLVYANSADAFRVGAAAGRRAGRKVIWHSREMSLADAVPSALVRGLARSANAARARVIAGSRAAAEAFVAAGGNRTLVRVVLDGADPSRFDATPATARDEVRRTLQIPPEAFVVGCFTTIGEHSGHGTLLDAIALSPTIHAIIAGAAADDDAHMLPLRAQAASVRLGGRAVLTGFRDDVPRLLAASDAVVHPGLLAPPFAHSIVEAMFARRAVIATAWEGAHELIRDGANGVLIAPGDARALATAMAVLRDEPRTRARLERAAREDARVRLSRDTMLAGIEQVIGEVAF